MHLNNDEESVLLSFDQSKLFEIISNLLSNAIKHTPSGKAVNVGVYRLVQSRKEDLVIKIEDEGEGVSSHDLERIFDRFYQIQNNSQQNRDESITAGSGIGLALVKRLVDLMKGKISVTSVLGKGSTFQLTFPIDKSEDKQDNPTDFPEVFVPKMRSVNEDASSTITIIDKLPKEHTILIVEDNVSISDFIADCLPSKYSKIFARTGEEGIEKAIKITPDLIISDVLMPKMDGFTMTDILKKDIRTSHIPILLLTAKAGMESRIEGFTKGADAYMPKPFNDDELVIRVENLLKSRKILQSFILQKMGFTKIKDPDFGTNSFEQDFISRVQSLIEKNLYSGSYSVDHLAKDVQMSTSQLYRKMLALTGISPIKFFRLLQIEQAKKLLQNSNLSISEVAYNSGFKDPAYFTRVFTAEVCCTPTDYRKSIN